MGTQTVAAGLVEHLEPVSRGDTAVDVRIGLGYTAVRLDSGSVGLAYTFRPAPQGGCSVFRGLRPLAGRRASELLTLLTSVDPLEAAVGLATANAFSSGGLRGATTGDVLDALELGSGDRVGMVGRFGPLVTALEKTAGRLVVFERDGGAAGTLPENAAAEWLPRCQVALITSTTLLNHTLGGLLASASTCRQVVLLGPSTPLFPEVFRHTPVTLLSGVEVTDPEGVLRVVGEGGGMPEFRGHIRKVNIVVGRS